MTFKQVLKFGDLINTVVPVHLCFPRGCADLEHMLTIGRCLKALPLTAPQALQEDQDDQVHTSSVEHSVNSSSGLEQSFIPIP